VSNHVSSYESLSREQLAVLVPELLLCGHLIDRSGMAWCISAFGREEMARIAIEEWIAASPIYTKRMQKTLRFEGNDVVTIFKGLQLDIGAPPQFMDFRYQVTDSRHGSFHLDHCGALMDVEPMGDDYVLSMCHDIEDPTFDATAVATNPKAQVRPVHRPPRRPTARTPHCEWTVIIDESYPEVSESEGCRALKGSHAASTELSPIDRDDEGQADYSGALVSDLQFEKFSKSALVRIAEEVCLQQHLLNLGFVAAVNDRVGAEGARAICEKQLVGIAGVSAERIHRALDLPEGVEGALEVLRLHPLLNPAQYVDASVDTELRVRTSAAHQDGGWITLCGPDSLRPLQAAVRAIDPHLDVEVDGSEDDWVARITVLEEPSEQFDEVAITRFSTGSTFEFEPRYALPITPI
jgi:hypothetical protein